MIRRAARCNHRVMNLNFPDGLQANRLLKREQRSESGSLVASGFGCVQAEVTFSTTWGADVLDEFPLAYNQRGPREGRGMNGRNRNSLRRRNAQAATAEEGETIEKQSTKQRLTPPAHSGTVTRLPSLYIPSKTVGVIRLVALMLAKARSILIRGRLTRGFTMRTEIELQPNFVFSRHNGIITYITNSRGPAPVLDPYCFGPVLSKRPSENSYVTAAAAGTIKQFVSGAVVDNIDQPGSIAYLDQVLTAGGVQTNVLVDGLDYTDIEALDFSHLYQQSLPGSVGVKIVGGPLAAAGNPNYSGLSSNEMVPCSPSDGSDTVEGRDGVDRLEFNGANVSENIDISANGARVRDVANITMDLNDVEPIRFQALDGADNVVIHDLSGTDVQASGIGSGGAMAKWTGSRSTARPATR